MSRLSLQQQTISQFAGEKQVRGLEQIDQLAKPISCSLVTYNPVPMRASDLPNLPPRGSVIPIQSILFEIQADLTGVF